MLRRAPDLTYISDAPNMNFEDAVDAANWIMPVGNRIPNWAWVRYVASLTGLLVSETLTRLEREGA